MATVTLRDEVRELLRELIRVDTTNPPGNETQAAELLREYLGDHGVQSELIARVPERANLVARIPGRRDGPSLLFLSHTDVVLADPAEWQADPFGGELRDGEVWARGDAGHRGQRPRQGRAADREARRVPAATAPDSRNRSGDAHRHRRDACVAGERARAFSRDQSDPRRSRRAPPVADVDANDGDC